MYDPGGYIVVTRAWHLSIFKVVKPISWPGGLTGFKWCRRLDAGAGLRVRGSCSGGGWRWVAVDGAGGRGASFKAPPPPHAHTHTPSTPAGQSYLLNDFAMFHLPRAAFRKRVPTPPPFFSAIHFGLGFHRFYKEPSAHDARPPARSRFNNRVRLIITAESRGYPGAR
jgi:hypothetical protein